MPVSGQDKKEALKILYFELNPKPNYELTSLESFADFVELVKLPAEESFLRRVVAIYEKCKADFSANETKFHSKDAPNEKRQKSRWLRFKKRWAQKYLINNNNVGAYSRSPSPNRSQRSRSRSRNSERETSRSRKSEREMKQKIRRG
jgi:hypothetical protein